MTSATTPEFARALLEWPWSWPVARFALVVMFLASGISKLVDFSGGVVEMKEAGLPAPVLMAVLGIAVELTGSVLVLINRWVWLGAGMLGAFTAIGAVTAHAPWRVQAPPGRTSSPSSSCTSGSSPHSSSTPFSPNRPSADEPDRKPPGASRDEIADGSRRKGRADPRTRKGDCK